MNQRSSVIWVDSPEDTDTDTDTVVSPTDVYNDESLVREDRINAPGDKYDSYHQS